jgi:hypothetical protein
MGKQSETSRVAENWKRKKHEEKKSNPFPNSYPTCGHELPLVATLQLFISEFLKEMQEACLVLNHNQTYYNVECACFLTQTIISLILVSVYIAIFQFHCKVDVLYLFCRLYARLPVVSPPTYMVAVMQ